MAQLDMNEIMKQARQMQEQLASAEDSLKDKEVTASAGGGTVKVTATGDMKITSITIDPEVLKDGEVELLQDMIMAAVNDALASAQELATSKLGDITGGLNIPGMF
ncbi:YbaB/EbfC family nucleoid-associated protein [Atopobium sp. oral taxon 416]|jgi:DNA-binding YbaB/EbfC family protein|uniref:YbaB/EbfC family nucleoid-associated protein n=1 Tax=Atopobium sp. oral taxon 416 TaxID=712157 RepID=UPI001BAC6738|nr:YbaB/EbfC family nucleoid-associated protein [Atopobium sp. oral taxon 416]QUC03493.1 YbaB/EbfC family nucleoid-associated protein [Atopobium sp. oral taxon 416]